MTYGGRVETSTQIVARKPTEKWPAGIPDLNRRY
jgi:hypothetical protein